MFLRFLSCFLHIVSYFPFFLSSYYMSSLFINFVSVRCLGRCCRPSGRKSPASLGSVSAFPAAGRTIAASLCRPVFCFFSSFFCFASDDDAGLPVGWRLPVWMASLFSRLQDDQSSAIDRSAPHGWLPPSERSLFRIRLLFLSLMFAVFSDFFIFFVLHILVAGSRPRHEGRTGWSPLAATRQVHRTIYTARTSSEAPTWTVLRGGGKFMYDAFILLCWWLKLNLRLRLEFLKWIDPRFVRRLGCNNNSSFVAIPNSVKLLFAFLSFDSCLRIQLHNDIRHDLVTLRAPKWISRE